MNYKNTKIVLNTFIVALENMENTDSRIYIFRCMLKFIKKNEYIKDILLQKPDTLHYIIDECNKLIKCHSIKKKKMYLQFIDIYGK